MSECIRTANEALTGEDMLAMGTGMTILILWFAFCFLIFGLNFVIVVGTYVATAIPIYKMAKNAGMSQAWLAWVPIAHTYVRLKLSRREFNIFNWIKTRNRDKVFEGYLWFLGGVILASILVLVMMVIPVINILGIILYYVIVYAAMIAMGVFMWRVNYDILMTYGMKEYAMPISVLNYMCPYIMIITTFKIMNTKPDYSI